jgi:hypothetical protein
MTFADWVAFGGILFLGLIGFVVAWFSTPARSIASKGTVRPATDRASGDELDQLGAALARAEELLESIRPSAVRSARS